MGFHQRGTYVHIHIHILIHIEVFRCLGVKSVELLKRPVGVYTCMHFEIFEIFLIFEM